MFRRPFYSLRRTFCTNLIIKLIITRGRVVRVSSAVVSCCFDAVGQRERVQNFTGLTSKFNRSRIHSAHGNTYTRRLSYGESYFVVTAGRNNVSLLTFSLVLSLVGARASKSFHGMTQSFRGFSCFSVALLRNSATWQFR